MLKEPFRNVYDKFKLHFYQDIFHRFQSREASLTTIETFCVETIHALGRPTVNEFATFLHISTSNAAYKVNSLVEKGYIRKLRSERDRREYHLEVTDKFLEYYNLSNSYVDLVMERIRDRFPPEECRKLEQMFAIIDEELMPEVQLPAASTQQTA